MTKPLKHYYTITMEHKDVRPDNVTRRSRTNQAMRGLRLTFFILFQLRKAIDEGFKVEIEKRQVW